MASYLSGHHWSADPREDPESYKKMRSGFWRRDVDVCTGEVRWTCDLFMLEDKVRELMCGPDRDVFHRDPQRCLDMLYGRPTGEVYFTKRRNADDRRIMFRDNPYYGERIDRCPTPPSPKKTSEKPYRSLVKTMPLQVSWINGQCSLISQLDKEFKAWAGSQLGDVQQWNKELSSSDLIINSTR